jgi:hypothetical protein
VHRERDETTRNRLVAALDGLVHTIATTTRRRTPVEAPEGLTGAYLNFVLASSFAQLGEHARAKRLVDDAHRALATVADDPVHRWLLRAFDARMEHAFAGRPRSAALPAPLMSELDELPRVARYKVDRLREGLPALAALPAFDCVEVSAIERFARRDTTVRVPRLWETITDLDARAAHADELVDAATTAPLAEAKRALADCFAALQSLPEIHAMTILARASPIAEKLADPEVCALALTVAAQFGWGELALHPTCSIRASVRAGMNPTELSRAFPASLRALRRLGMHSEIVGLLADVDQVLQVARIGPTRDAMRLTLGGGWSFVGDSRAASVFEDAHTTLDQKHSMENRLGLTRSLASAYSHATVTHALAGVLRLAKALPEITDDRGTSSHYCFSVLHFIASLVLVLENLADDGVSW